MKSIREAAESMGASEKLVTAVIHQMGGTIRGGKVDKETADTLRDVVEHGASGGFSGFIYYTETGKFYRGHRADILKLCESMAEQIGDGGALALVRGFNCLNSGDWKNRKPDFSEDEIGRVLYGGRATFEGSEQIENALAWFALEETARAIVGD